MQNVAIALANGCWWRGVSESHLCNLVQVLWDRAQHMLWFLAQSEIVRSFTIHVADGVDAVVKSYILLRHTGVTL